MRTHIPGTHISIVPPAGLAPAKHWPGYICQETRRSIMVSEPLIPFAIFRESLTAETLAVRGMTLLAIEDIDVEGWPAAVCHVAQIASDGMPYEKWILVVGDDVRTAMVTATFPKEADEAASEPLRLALLSTTFDPELTSDPLDMLPFTFHTVGEFEVSAHYINTVVLTKSGKCPSCPVMLLGASMGKAVGPQDAEQFAIDRLEKTANLSVITVEACSKIKVGDLPAYEVQARATNGLTEQKMFVLHTLLFDETGYFIAQGFAPIDERENYLPIYRSITGSIRRKTS